VLRPGAYEEIIVMAPDHRVGLSNAVITRADAYETPLGRIRLHRDASALRQQHDLFASSRASDDTEHAVEVVLPVLQRFAGRFELVPVVLGPCDTDRVAACILPLLDDNTLLVVSTDLSHYLPYDEAVARDRRTLEMIVAGEAGKLAKLENGACGKAPLLVLLRIAQRLGWEPVLLHRSNSGDTAGSRDRVVGYAAVAFYGGPSAENSRAKTEHVTPVQGRSLVKLARMSIEQHLLKPDHDRVSTFLAEMAREPELQRTAGTFVTLQHDHRLRGCIGSLTADEPIPESVRRNAVRAAFHDPRFPPLRRDELAGLHIEVSILSRPEPVAYQNGADLISKLRVNEDGVILQKGAARATFLPQVWQQLPEPEAFLNRLCLKAGLPPHAWQAPGLDVKTYQVQYFDERN
jgi:AmmeMemoRadiSam system protein A/AmmeMemoRadiSam system protein B